MVVVTFKTIICFSFCSINFIWFDHLPLLKNSGDYIILNKVKWIINGNILEKRGKLPILDKVKWIINWELSKE